MSTETPSSPGRERPLDRLRVIAKQDVLITPGLRHIEGFTFEGLLTFLWHGDPTNERVVLMCGGALGGLLGPAEALYHELGETFAAAGIGTIRIGYRKPNDLDACVLDVAGAADLAHRNGARRFVVMGHSFGGAVAVNAGIALRPMVAGVVTLSTQSAGCEGAAGLRGRPLLLLHGDRDELLPVMASQAVQALAGSGEVVVLPGAGHLLVEAAADLRTRLGQWIPDVLSRPVTGDADV
ncbi:MAG TPA: alpha/beta hydrolase [Candidatus Binatia bacterium]|jgi:pimeloyl-ACP methyl ester carboxylesterase|nr:alpha/beta hydrolase [Candidatus Binatia bacterium]